MKATWNFLTNVKRFLFFFAENIKVNIIIKSHWCSCRLCASYNKFRNEVETLKWKLILNDDWLWYGNRMEFCCHHERRHVAKYSSIIPMKFLLTNLKTSEVATKSKLAFLQGSGDWMAFFTYRNRWQRKWRTYLLLRHVKMSPQPASKGTILNGKTKEKKKYVFAIHFHLTCSYQSLGGYRTFYHHPKEVC